MLSIASYIDPGVKFEAFYTANETEATTAQGGAKFKTVLHREITYRLYGLGELIIFPIATALDLIFGSLAAIGSILTLGLIKPLNKTAFRLLNHARRCVDAKKKWDTYAGPLSHFYFSLTWVISLIPPCPLSDELLNKNPLRGAIKKLNLTIESLKQPQRSFVERHLVTRLGYLGKMLLDIVNTILEFVVGIFLAIGSILILGKSEKLNIICYYCLDITKLLSIIFLNIISIINPCSDFGQGDCMKKFLDAV
jgi:hypothetical protein